MKSNNYEPKVPLKTKITTAMDRHN